MKEKKRIEKYKVQVLWANSREVN